MIAPLVGAVLLLAAVAFGVRWYRSRRPAPVVETVDGPVRLSGMSEDVDGLLADRRAALDDRPDPGTLFD